MLNDIKTTIPLCPSFQTEIEVLISRKIRQADRYRIGKRKPKIRVSVQARFQTRRTSKL
jgi:hypothetical protein